MISATSIRKAFKLAVWDPKIPGTSFYVEARDMTSHQHFLRAKMLITYYFDGVKGINAILESMWHLAAGVAKLEEIYSAKAETRGSDSTGQADKVTAN